MAELTVSLAPSVSLGAQDVLVRAGVIDSLRRPVPAAEIVVTNSVTRAFARGVSDSGGRLDIRISATRGQSLVVFASQAAFGASRVVVTPLDSQVTVQLVLPARQSQLLASVRVKATKVQAPESLDRGETAIGVGGGERLVSSVRGALSPDQQGDLAETARLSGALVSGPGGLYSLGAGGDQAVFASDGLGLAGSRVPREGRTAVTVMTSPFDIAVGGFAGVMVNVTPSPASQTYNFTSASFYGASAEARRRYPLAGFGASRGQIGVSFGSTRTWADRLGLNASMDVRLSSETAPLSSGTVLASPSCVECTTIRDASAGFGLALGGGGTSSLRGDVLALARLDLFRGRRRPLTMIMSAEASNVPGTNAAFASTATARNRRSSAGTVQLQWRGYSPSNRWALDIRSGVRHGATANRPVANGPQVRVQLNEAVVIDGVEASSLVLGSAATAATDVRGTTAETLVDVQRRLGRGVNTVKLVGWLRADRNSETQEPGRLLDLDYATPSDFATNRPVRLRARETLAPGQVAAGNGALGIANLFSPTHRFKLYTGVRLEASTVLPGYGGSSGPFLPARGLQRSMSVSPRVALDWMTIAEPPGWTIQGGPVAAPFVAREPTGILRIGLGRFQGRQATGGLPLQALLASRVRGMQQTCSAPGIAPFTWAAGQVPAPATESCLVNDVTDTTSTRLALSPGLAPPASWRTTLGYSRSFLGVRAQVDAQWALNVQQPLLVNRNFVGTPAFRICGEECRPVFVRPTLIDEATATSSPIGSRVSASDGDAVLVIAGRSGGSSATLLLSPESPILKARVIVSLAYTLANVWSETNGYTSTTTGDPRVRERGPSPFDARHLFALQAGYAAKRLVFTTVVTAQSGLPFDPLVGSDINGDGRANDRAFIPAIGDTGLLGGMDIVRALSSVPGAVRTCIFSARNGFAAPGACRAPWSVTSRLRVESRNPVQIPGIRALTRLALQIENPLAAVAKGLGWSSLSSASAAASLDPVLLRATSFSRQRQAFTYAVNPTFAQPIGRGFGSGLPRVTLDVTMDLSAPLPAQIVARAIRETSRGQVRVLRSADRIREVYVERMMPIFTNIYDALEADGFPADSIALLTTIEERFRTSADSLWKPASERVAALATAAASGDLVRELARTERAMWDGPWAITARSLMDVIGSVRTTSLKRAGFRFVLEREPGAGYNYFGRRS